MAKPNQTVETRASVPAFIKAAAGKEREADCKAILKMMKEESGYPPRMWGPAIVGFGSFHYKYESGREGDSPLVGFSPRKNVIVFYIGGFDQREAMLKKLGKHTTGKVCVYVKKLSDIDTSVLRKMIRDSVKHHKKKYKLK